MTDAGDIAQALSSTEAARDVVMAARARWWVRAVSGHPTAARLIQLGLVTSTENMTGQGFMLPITPLGHAVADELARIHEETAARYRASCGAGRSDGEQSSMGRETQ